MLLGKYVKILLEYIPEMPPIYRIKFKNYQNIILKIAHPVLPRRILTNTMNRHENKWFH